MNLELRIVQALMKLNKFANNFDKAKSEKMNITINQINIIIKELEKMKIKMNPKSFYPSYGHIIVDSWFSHEEKELSNELLKIENDYNKLKH